MTPSYCEDVWRFHTDRETEVRKTDKKSLPVTRLGLWSLQNLTFGTGSHFTLVAESMELQFLH